MYFAKVAASLSGKKEEDEEKKSDSKKVCQIV
jgi:hypothetical protein